MQAGKHSLVLVFLLLLIAQSSASAKDSDADPSICSPVLLINKHKTPSQGTSTSSKLASTGGIKITILYPEGGESFKLGDGLPVLYLENSEYIASRNRFYLVDQSNNWREISWHHNRASFPYGTLIELLKSSARYTDVTPKQQAVTDPAAYLDGTPIKPGKYRLGARFYVDGPPHFNINYAEGNTVAGEEISREFTLSDAGNGKKLGKADLVRICEKNKLDCPLWFAIEKTGLPTLSRGGRVWFKESPTLSKYAYLPELK